ncbi:GGDEF domain-containing protein [Paraburkholderia phosphatilytica]|uniref:GGDEF domain-containing protein n=1 Tax=Paraburkholderia phosphatilytica TaxID=2282883 RepID=UPI000E4EC43F|nr:GGDEF domain-containing protein [Paraburkholderia phosphatilytica]
MNSSPWNRLGTLLWTSERRTAVRLQNWWLTVLVYAGSAAAMSAFVHQNIISARSLLVWLVCVLSGLSVFHYLIRSGWSKRFADPALAQAQIIFAVFAIAAGYTVTETARSAVLLPLVLVLNFGAFSIRWRRMIELTIFALGVMALTMAWMHAHWPNHYSSIVDASNFLLSMVTLPGVAGLAMRLNSLQARLHQQRVELKNALDRIQDLATRDELTGLVNRRRANELLSSQMTRVDRATAPFAIALIDLDHFKRLNDHFGHAGGDQILRRFSEEARGFVRNIDTVARWGGEEFLILMPNADEHFALQLLERLRIHIEGLRTPGTVGEMRFTLSAGVASWRIGQTADETIARADRALYQAKHSGRNCVKAEADTLCDVPVGASGNYD